MPRSSPRSAAASRRKSGGSHDRAARGATGGARESRQARGGGDRDASQGARHAGIQAGGGRWRPRRARAPSPRTQGDAGAGQRNAQGNGEARPMSDAQRVEVEILGQQYTIKSAADPKYVRDLATYVEKSVKHSEGQLVAQDHHNARRPAGPRSADQ